MVALWKCGERRGKKCRGRQIAKVVVGSRRRGNEDFDGHMGHPWLMNEPSCGGGENGGKPGVANTGL